MSPLFSPTHFHGGYHAASFCYRHHLRSHAGESGRLGVRGVTFQRQCYAAAVRMMANIDRPVLSAGNRARRGRKPCGRRRIEDVSPRIYGPVIEWDGRWRMIVYGIAEARRESRDRLRKELAVLGWAPLAPSVWISRRQA